MRYVILALAVLLFGCVVQPAGPMEEGIKPPSDLDVKDAIDDEEEMEEEMEEDVTAPEVNETANDTTSGPSGNDTADDAEASDVSASALSQHNSGTDCWVLYEGKVYDVTDYMQRHGGGSEVFLPSCGATDTTFMDDFEGKHGTALVQKFMGNGILIGDYAG